VLLLPDVDEEVERIARPLRHEMESHKITLHLKSTSSFEPNWSPASILYVPLHISRMLPNQRPESDVAHALLIPVAPGPP